MEYSKLIKEAIKAKDNAYAPYSKYKVGAAIVTNNGNIYTGCNIENSSYPIGVCAEKVALSKAISCGDNKAFEAIAIVSDGDDYPTPCGGCRQFLSEFVGSDFKVILAKSTEDYKIVNFAELLPLSFKLER